MTCLAGRPSTEVACLQDGSAQRTFALDEVRKQATQVGTDALAMPARVERISATLSSLEAGDTKLRVRALEVERAAKRASVMQVGTTFFSTPRLVGGCQVCAVLGVAFNGTEGTAGSHQAPCCWFAMPVQGTKAAVCCCRAHMPCCSAMPSLLQMLPFPKIELESRQICANSLSVACRW